MKKIAANRNYRLLKNAHGRDPDKVIQEDLFDMLVANGLSEDLAAIVVSNIGRMDMRGLWRKVKKYTNSQIEEPEETEDDRDTGPFGRPHPFPREPNDR
tara:strand:- start:217 stop:513 length:297 start_codon:yes stop_codon:yes gene_type:complete